MTSGVPSPRRRTGWSPSSTRNPSCLVIAATALGVVIALEDDIRETADEIRHEEALRSAEALERVPTA